MSAQIEPEKEKTELATLKLTRHGDFAFELRRGTFEIEIDGRAIGSMEYNETFEAQVEPGHHTLRMRKGRYSSQEHSFDAVSGDEVSFRCHGAMLWPRFVASFLVPSLAIALIRE
jgi:hypothetical protein